MHKRVMSAYCFLKEIKQEQEKKKSYKHKLREFSGSPVARTWCFHCHGPEFNSWSSLMLQPTKQNKQHKHKYKGIKLASFCSYAIIKA